LPDSFEDKIIKDITNCIYDNLGNPDFKVDMLAQVVGLSRSQLYRKVVSVVGQSPNEYIKTLRLQRSVEMLKTNKYRIAEIAYEVGFSDPGYFSSCFVERYGLKPSEYAKKM
jgi:AraC-like DNA-binding protein